MCVKLKFDSQLKFFVLTGVPLIKNSNPLFRIEPTFLISYKNPELGLIGIWLNRSLDSLLKYEPSKERRFLRNFKSKPISNSLRLSFFILGLPLTFVSRAPLTGPTPGSYGKFM